MFYTGHDGNGWRIGYAYSTNGIDNWIDYQKPIIDKDINDNWEIDVADPTVISTSSGFYQMFYTSASASWIAGPDRFRTRYAYTNDPTNWTKYPGWVMYGSSGKWDSGGTARGRSILYRDGIYHMWYAGTNENNLGINPYWRIGYATSTDAVNWTKQNDGNPVLEPTEPWELNNVSYPSVIYEDGIYKMWYAAAPGDNPTQIVYATSSDGIHWDKPTDKNPVLTLGNSGFDSSYIAAPFVLRDNDVYKMWYSGFDRYNWRIGYATASADPLPSPTPTPTPTPSPTPPPEVDKVFVLPGFGASWNSDAILNCKTDNYKGNWLPAPYANTILTPLINSLKDNGYTTKPFYYDWRLVASDSAEILGSYIDRNLSDTEKAYAVGHSMGGLIGRTYIEKNKENNKLDKLMTAGSPHQGTSLAYSPWSGGDIWESNLVLKIAMTLILNRCKGYNQREKIEQNVPSIQNLLPIYDYMRDMQTGIVTPVSQMKDQNNWLPGDFRYPYYDVILGTLSGTGYETLNIINFKQRSSFDALLGNWEDGKPVSGQYSSNGDGTVMITSSQLENADNRVINKTHNELIASQEGINEILSFLNGGYTKPSESLFTEPKSALIVIGYPAALWVTDTQGKITKDTDSMVAYLNPKAGDYKLKILPSTNSTLLLVGQFLEDKILWKEYQLFNILPKFKTITFDPLNPLEDALK